jgi:hypothetical protein
MFEVERGSTAELKFCARTVRREALSIPPFLKSILKLEFGMFQTFWLSSRTAYFFCSLTVQVFFFVFRSRLTTSFLVLKKWVGVSGAYCSLIDTISAMIKLFNHRRLRGVAIMVALGIHISMISINLLCHRLHAFSMSVSLLISETSQGQSRHVIHLSLGKDFSRIVVYYAQICFRAFALHGMFAGVYWLKKRGEEGEGVWVGWPLGWLVDQGWGEEVGGGYCPLDWLDLWQGSCSAPGDLM